MLLSERIEISYFGRLWSPTPKQWQVHLGVQDMEASYPVAYIGLIGASRSAKSVLLINELIDHALRFPGYQALLSRWTDEATQSILRPLFYEIANSHYHPSLLGQWIAKEERQLFANGSSIYIKGLKSGDDTNRYSKFDGLSLSGVYVSQAEELPRDVFERLKTRLSYPGTSRLFLFEMNPVMRNHYIFKEFEAHNGYHPGLDHRFYHVSVYDNAENLPEGYIDGLERAYPPGHPLRHRLIEGKWGMETTGDPIIGPNLFNPKLHIEEIDFDLQWPLLLSYDPGFRHPALTWAQLDGDQQLRILDCVIGTDIDADTFFFSAFSRQNEIIGKVKEVRACADKASEQRKGTSTRTEWDIFREHLRPWGIHPITGAVASKQYLIQRLASRFTRLVRGRPAIVFHPRCEYLIEAMTGGWVWRQPTDLRPTAQVPVDNFYGHGADSLTYLEMHYGPGIRTITKVRGDDDESEERYHPRRRASAAGY